MSQQFLITPVRFLSARTLIPRLQAALRAAGIVPSRNRSYRTQDLIDAIYKAYGVRVLIHCYNKQLSEVGTVIRQYGGRARRATPGSSILASCAVRIPSAASVCPHR